MRDSLLIVKFNPKNYIFEICWAIITLIFATFLIYTARFLPFQFWIKETNIPLPISWIKVIIWLILYFTTKPIAISLFKIMFYQGSYYKFKSSHWPNKWKFHGGVLVENQDSLIVRNSRAGCLLSMHQWKNLKMNFSMQFLREYSGDIQQYSVTRSLGIIFRAQDLENYFMLEVWAGETGDTYIKPHVRMFGNWEDVDNQMIGNFSLNVFHNVEIMVMDNTIKISIDECNPFSWIIPTHVNPNQFESLPDDTASSTGIGKIPEISFRLSYGMIGFRAYPGQGAIVRGLEIRNM